jgi:sulfur-carrier protein
MIRVKLPYHLRNLAKVGAEVGIEVEGAVTIGSVLDALEARYPALNGTIRDHMTKKRRPFVRFFACEEDYSHEASDTSLPKEVCLRKRTLFNCRRYCRWLIY